MNLTVNTLEVLRKRYLLKDSKRRIVESPDALFRRVAKHIAKAEDGYSSAPGRGHIEEQFYTMMRGLEFMPNSPTLMNAGTPLGQLSACFVIPIEDSIEGIFDAVKEMAKIHQTGGGTGFDFSTLRPKGDIVNSTKGEASGPVSFMRIFDEATGVVVQGGRRRGANMGILRCDHPDIEEFVGAKTDGVSFSNFNISVAVTDKFMDAAKLGRWFDLINPRTKRAARRVRANELFDRIIHAAWKTGDPGLVFIDEVNRRNPTPLAGKIEATNPCGELPLLPYESCNLASINLGRMVKSGGVDWEKLKDRVHLGVRFLDDVIDVNKFPLPEIKRITFANRKIGLGVMGFADMLIKLNISYNSKAAVDLSARVMRFIHNESLSASSRLAKERGVFPNFRKSIYVGKNLRLRNATVNTVAPTGTISIIAGCSSGIEPIFAVSFVRNILSGERLFEINPLFEGLARERGFYPAAQHPGLQFGDKAGRDLLRTNVPPGNLLGAGSRQSETKGGGNPGFQAGELHKDALMKEIARRGSLRGVKGIPQDVKNIFSTAFDVEPLQHLKIQAAFQRYSDNSVSKTINLPADAAERDIKNIYVTAHKLKCKGITVYRYGSKDKQVLSFGSRPVKAGPEYSGGCISGTCSF